MSVPTVQLGDILPSYNQSINVIVYYITCYDKVHWVQCVTVEYYGVCITVCNLY